MSTPQLLFDVIVAILVINYLAEQYLEYLNADYDSFKLAKDKYWQYHGKDKTIFVKEEDVK